MRKFIIMTSSAHMPHNCYGRYGNVAVVEVAVMGKMPKAIDERHKSIASIPFYRGKLNMGKTEKCAFRRALATATRLAAELNQKWEEMTGPVGCRI